MKKLLMVLVGIVAIMGCVKLLSLHNDYEYNRATEKCGGEVVTNYDNAGEIYYTCK